MDGRSKCFFLLCRIQLLEVLDSRPFLLQFVCGLLLSSAILLGGLAEMLSLPMLFQNSDFLSCLCEWDSRSGALTPCIYFGTYMSDSEDTDMEDVEALR